MTQLCVLRGRPTDAELAALVAVFALLGARGPDADGRDPYGVVGPGPAAQPGRGRAGVSWRT
jgi:hypothetical protein